MKLGRFLIPLGVFALLVLFLAVGLNHSREVGVLKSPLVNHDIPQWELPLLNDPQHRLGSQALKGQWYVLNVWGSWCPACRQEHPVLLKARASSSVRIIGVDWKDDDADANEWLTKLGNPYTDVVSDRAGDTAINLGVAAAPETFLVNPEGVIVYKQVGEVTPRDWQNEFLGRLPPELARSAP